MRIAFDLDKTLIPCDNESPVISKIPRPLMKLCGYEPLREGTVELLKSLQKQGNEIWIYTTSLRNVSSIKWLFLLHGVYIDGVVNQELHNKKVRSEHIYCSKYPPAFGIDVLVDNEEGVQLEASKYNFDLIWIQPEDTDWVNTIKKAFHRYGYKAS